LDRGIKAAIKEIVGEENFTEQLIDLVSYSYDASGHDHRPAAAVWPENTQQIARVLALADRQGLAVIPRGAGTGLAGGAVPIRGGLVLDLCRMNNILDIRIPDRLAVVQPGVVYAELQKALAPAGFCFPPDPASGSACTLGGNTATNAGGIHGAKYGTTRDYVLALEVVLADGRILRTGSRCMKSVSGYDLMHLFVGSEGTLGVITEITLKISPRPPASATALAAFPDLDDAGRAVAEVMRSGIIPSVLEILDENTIRLVREHGGMPLSAAKAIILAETDGYTAAEAQFQMQKIVEVFKKNAADDVQAAASAEEADSLWKVRRSISGLVAKLRPSNLSEDVSVPMSRVPELLTAISRIVHEHSLPFVIFGHAGDGNLHPKIMYDSSNPEEFRRLRRAADEIFKRTCEAGGTLTGEHGIGLEKAPYMHFEHDAVALEVMQSLKRILDPRNILNPGKLFQGS
jgi:glycolate oxidase